MLHQLVEYTERNGIAAEEGFVPKSVRWLLIFSTKGKFLGISPAGDPKKGRQFPNVPNLRFSGDSPKRQFLVDTAEFALLFTPDKPDKKLLAKHDFFLDLLRQSATAEPFLGQVADALSAPAVLAEIHAALAQQTPPAKPSDNVTFVEKTALGDRIIVQEDSWRNWWRGHFRSLLPGKNEDESAARCMLSGELLVPARTHPKIKGLGDVGGLIQTTLVGFDKDSFCSYGLSQSNNAAIGKELAEKYAAGLNHLIERGKRLAGSKIVYWYTGPVEVPAELDLFAGLFGQDDEPDGDAAQSAPAAAKAKSNRREMRQAEGRVKKLLAAIREGNRPAKLKDCRFCALTLSGNAGRVVVRDWMEGSFDDLARNIKAWFDDLSIISRTGMEEAPPPKFKAVLYAMVRDFKDVPAPLEAELWRCAVRNLPLPYQAMARALDRTRIDIVQGNSPTHARIGLLKAYLIRKGIKMNAELMQDCNDPAYLSGRIMAILAAIQYRALGDVGAGVTQRYYAAASTTPALVLGRLVRLAQVGHLSKIEPIRLRNWFDRQLADVWSRMEASPPKSLTLEQQTLFAMGYYHQKAYRAPDAASAPETNTEKSEQ